MTKIEGNNVIKKLALIFYFSGLILIPTVLLILPTDYFDEGKSVCLSVLLFKEQCYACGMTRAIQHLLHFDFLTAYSYNKASFILFFILAFIWLTETIHSYKKIKTSEYDEQYAGPLSGMANVILIATSKIKTNNKEQVKKTMIRIGLIAGIVSSLFFILISIAIGVMLIYHKSI